MTDWITDTLTELLLPSRRRVPPSLPAAPTRPASSPLLAGALILAASSANAGDPLPAYMEPPVARPAVDCSIAPPWRTECQGARRQSDRTAAKREAKTTFRDSFAPEREKDEKPRSTPEGCNSSCPDVTSEKQREYISRWKDKPLAERQAIKARQTGNGRERARDRRDARDECIADRDSARN